LTRFGLVCAGLLIMTAFAVGEEAKPEEMAYPELGFKFTVPEGALMRIDELSRMPKGEWKDCIFTFFICDWPGDFASLLDKFDAQMLLVGCEKEHAVERVGPNSVVTEVCYHVPKYGDREKEKAGFLYVFPLAQGAHRYLYVYLLAPWPLKDQDKYYEVARNVTVWDALKDKIPPANHLVFKEKGLGITTPWFWKPEKDARDALVEYVVFHSKGLPNSVDLYTLPCAEADLKKAVEAELEAKKKAEGWKLEVCEPVKMGANDALDVEMTYRGGDIRWMERWVCMLNRGMLVKAVFKAPQECETKGMRDFLDMCASIELLEPEKKEAPPPEEKKE